MINKLVISIDNTDIFPVFVDYDFEKKRCRGFSLKMDFFYKGKLNDIVLQENTNLIFVKKDIFFFDNGFFLYDFKKIVKNVNSFIDILKNLNFWEIYLEKSKFFNDEIYEFLLDNVKLNLLEFV